MVPLLAKSHEQILEIGAAELNGCVALILGWQVFPYLSHAQMTGHESFDYCPPGQPVHINNVKTLPNFSEDMGAAWQLVDLTGDWLFSQRQKFYRTLDHLVRPWTRHDGCTQKSRVVWPNAIRNLTPEIICRAFLSAHPTRSAAPE